MKKFEFTGKSIRQAVDLGLKELNLKQEEVDVKVITEGGFFSKAKIALVISDELAGNMKTLPDKKGKQRSDGLLKNDAKKDDKNKNNKKTTEKQFKKKLEDNKEERASVVLIRNIIKFFDEENHIKTKIEEDVLNIEIIGKNAKNIIGYRGVGIKAIQTIVRAIEHKEQKRYKINIDIEKYKDQRKKQLENLAENIANKVIRTGKEHRFEPMNSYERLIIHSKISEYNNITTKSEGIDPNRFLIVKPKI